MTTRKPCPNCQQLTQQLDHWRGAYDHEAKRVDTLMEKLSELKPQHLELSVEPKAKLKVQDEDDPEVNLPGVVAAAIQQRGFDETLKRTLYEFAITSLRAGQKPRWVAQQIMEGQKLEPDYDDAEQGLEDDEELETQEVE